MKKVIKGVIVGFGNRGEVYGDYSLQTKGEFEVIAVVDPNPFKLKLAKEKYSLKDEQLFPSLEDFFKKNIKADIVINTTMDQDHYETVMKILSKKYDMLMEKPIVGNDTQLTKIADLAKKNKCKVFVCHVLRYTMFYRTIKQLINDNKIGEVQTIEVNEHIALQHYLSSYLRGKWNSEAKCGSGLLLAKSCHDLDLLCWLNNSTKPAKVCSFGSRKLFVKENKPKGAAKFCHECKHKDTCPLSSVTLYEKHDVFPFLVYDRLNKPLDKITLKEKKAFLHKDVYGKCAYDVASDLVDRQVMIIEYENGSTATFTLVSCSTEPNRYIHIVGSKGEIEGKVENNIITLRTFEGDVVKHKTKTIDLSSKIVNLAKFGGHSGGDYLIMHDLCAYLNGDRSSISMTKLNDSLNGHRCVYAAEKSRRTNKIINL